MWIDRKNYDNLVEELNHLRGQRKELDDLIGKYRAVPELTSQIDDLQSQLEGFQIALKSMSIERNFFRDLYAIGRCMRRIHGAGTDEAYKSMETFLAQSYNVDPAIASIRTDEIMTAFRYILECTGMKPSDNATDI